MVTSEVQGLPTNGLGVGIGMGFPLVRAAWLKVAESNPTVKMHNAGNVFSIRLLGTIAARY